MTRSGCGPRYICGQQPVTNRQSFQGNIGQVLVIKLGILKRGEYANHLATVLLSSLTPPRLPVTQWSTAAVWKIMAMIQIIVMIQYNSTEVKLQNHVDADMTVSSHSRQKRGRPQIIKYMSATDAGSQRRPFLVSLIHQPTFETVGLQV